MVKKLDGRTTFGKLIFIGTFRETEGKKLYNNSLFLYFTNSLFHYVSISLVHYFAICYGKNYVSSINRINF